MTPSEFYGRCWDILVEHAGADARPQAKKDFVITMVDREPCHEYRFCGCLGFGGKFYRDSTPDICVRCYPEDMTPERQETIDKVNSLFEGLITTAQKDLP